MAERKSYKRFATDPNVGKINWRTAKRLREEIARAGHTSSSEVQGTSADVDLVTSGPSTYHYSPVDEVPDRDDNDPLSQEGPPLVEDYSIEAEEAQESTSSSDRETSSIDSATQKDVKEPSSSSDEEEKCASSSDLKSLDGNEESAAVQDCMGDHNWKVYHPLISDPRVVEGVSPEDLDLEDLEPHEEFSETALSACDDVSDSGESIARSGDEQISEEAAHSSKFLKLNELIQGEYSEPITVSVTATRGELLSMALAFRHHSHLSNRSFMNSVNLLNSAFASPILPYTQHLMDKLVFDDSVVGLTRHFFCKNCQRDFEDVNPNVTPVIKCEGCKTENILCNVNEASHFVLVDMIGQLEILLEEDDNYSKLISPGDCVEGKKVFCDIVDGLMYVTFVKSLKPGERKVISFILGVDGSPLFKTSKGSIWPVFVQVVELPPLIRMKNVLLGGLWFGKDKPAMDLFLKTFVTRFSPLSDPGFDLKLRSGVMKMKAFVIAACVDSGARGSVQGISTHSGYVSCCWCEHVGEYVEDAVKFPEEIPMPPLRKHEDLVPLARKALTKDFPRGLSKRDKAILLKGVKGPCALRHLKNFDCVQGFIVEYLHGVCLGVVKRMLSVWLKDYISEDELVKVEDNIRDKLTPPVELRRILRAVEERKFWNGRDFENFLLYFSVPLLFKILSKEQRNHWLLLVQAIYLLLQREMSEQDAVLADKLLNLFISGVENLYGKREMTYNVHILRHLARSAVLWGPIWASSGHSLEHANGTVKNIVHSASGVPHQVCRNLSEHQATRILDLHFSSSKTKRYKAELKKKPVQKGLSVGSCHYFGGSIQFSPSESEAWLCEQLEIDPKNCVVYKKVIKDKCLYRSEKSKSKDNTVAVTIDNRVIVIHKLIFSNSTEGFVFVKQAVCSPVFQCPGVQIPLEKQCVKQIVRIHDQLDLIPLSSLKSVCCRTTLTHGDFVALIPNLFNVY